jgi:hypothetical protein
MLGNKILIIGTVHSSIRNGHGVLKMNIYDP